jgi:myo-inositol-1(or 4)-monophosphatase
MIPHKSREILKSAVKAAGTVLLDHFGKPLEISVKENISSIVTEADLASERTIIEILESTSEPCNILSEESGFRDHRSSYTWVIDPLDGTSNFAAGLPWFGVIITLFHEEAPIQAAMYLPVDDLLYYGGIGKGAWRNQDPIRCSKSKDLNELLIAYSFDFNSDPGKTDREMDLMGKLSRKIRNTRSTNSLVDFCYTSDGRLGAAINQTTRIWDIAAPWLLIKEAGGVVTDISGTEILFDLEKGAFDQNYTIVAAASGIHDHLMDIINQ